MTRTAIYAFVTISALLLSACGSSGDSGGSQSPDYNVVILSVDALRADHVGAYGYDRPTTPFLDSLAAESVVFDRAYAPSSYPSQSVSAILTGRLPTSGGSVSMAAAPHEDAETLGRLFLGAGLHTGMFSNQGLLVWRGFTRGFEGIQVADAETTAQEVTELALQFVDDYSPERFMVFAHYVEPHSPYTPPPSPAQRLGVDSSDVSVAALRQEIDTNQSIPVDDPRIGQLKARYDAEIATVDEAIRSLVDGLDERGLSNNTIIVVTGSQGQEFLEHGYLDHAWTLYEEQLRVPLIIHAPGLIDPQRVSNPVSTVDVYPSLVDLFNLDLDTDAWPPDGTSFIGGAGEIRVLESPKFAELVVRERCVVRAVILGDWKYIADYIPCPVEDRMELELNYFDLVEAIGSGEVDEPSIWGDIVGEQLYNLADDPGETRNRLDEDSAQERLEYLRNQLSDYAEYSELYALKPVEAIPAGLKQALCGMGYGGNC